MSDQPEKKKVVEWSYSFDKLNDTIQEQIKKMGVNVEPQEVKHEHFSAGLENAKSAVVQLDLSIGRVNVQALSDSDSLIEAEIAYIGEIKFDVSGDAEKRVRLGQRHGVSDTFNQIRNHEDLRWDISLSPNIPLSLDVNGGVGRFDLDLTGLKITGVTMNGGVGDNRLTLPAADKPYSAKIKGGVGSVRATIAEGASVNLSVDGGVGGMKIEVPANAAVQIRVEGGLGGVSLPSRFNRVKGGNDFMGQNGVWETEGYALAAQQIRVDFRGGVGGLKVVTGSV